ncbi:MAG: hypothetical protein IIC78_10635 [Chloroflexi bacterium]|nr:hypothetical protein [Chloroflexota bacterium]
MRKRSAGRISFSEEKVLVHAQRRFFTSPAHRIRVITYAIHHERAQRRGRRLLRPQRHIMEKKVADD